MMQDNDLKNSKSKDKGSRSRSQSMNEQSHYKQDKTKTRQSINVKSHIFNVIDGHYSDHAAHWSSYIGEVIRGVSLYYPSWLKVPKEQKAAFITDIGTQFDLRPHMESLDWTEINAGIQQHLQKAYNTNKAAFKAHHWVIDPTTGTYNVEKIRRACPEDITAEEWDKDPGRLLAFEMRWQSLGTQEYPSLIDTFFVAHTVNGEFLQDEDRHIYEEMWRLEATGTYTDDEINRLSRRGKQRGHIPGVGRVLPARASTDPNMFSQFESGGASGSGGCGDDEESTDDQEDEDEDGDGDSYQGVRNQIFYEQTVLVDLDYPGCSGVAEFCFYEHLGVVSIELCEFQCSFDDHLGVVSIFSECSFPNENPMGMGTNPTFLAFHQALPFNQVLHFSGIQAILDQVGTSSKVHLIDIHIRSQIQWTAMMQALTVHKSRIELRKLTSFATSTDAQKVGKLEKDL
ncbi:F-box domain containing protein [Tanacetum coccineum]